MESERLLDGGAADGGAVDGGAVDGGAVDGGAAVPAGAALPVPTGSLNPGAAPAWDWRAWVRRPPGADLSTATVAAYGLGGIVVAMCNDVVGIFITPFLLEVARMSPLLAGNMLLVAKLVDAVTDPMIGTASDATRSRFGRRRPWMAASLPLVMTFTMLLWHRWPALDGNGGAQFAYYLCMLCASTFGMTCYYIPAAALVNTISTKDVDRVRLVAARAGQVIVGTILGVLSFGLISAAFPVEELGAGYMVAAAVNTAIVTLATVLSVTFVHEPSSLTMVPRSFLEEMARFGRGVADLLRSWPYMCLVIIGSLCWMGMALVQNNLILFSLYSADLPDVYILILMIALCSCGVFVPLSYWFLTFMSKRTLLALGTLWMMGTWLGMLLFPAGSIAVAIVLAILSGGGITVTGLLPWVMLADVIDMDELMHGRRREGLMSAFFVSLNKISGGIALAISGLILSAGGYDNQDGTVPPPSPELDRTMRLLCGVIPLCCVGAILPFLYFYPITPTVQRRLNADLIAQRQRLVDEKAAESSSADALAPSRSDVSFGRGLHA